jgi:hypothetical protein
VACNDDEVPGGKTSAAVWQADGGDYLIVVGAFPGHPGNVLQLRVIPTSASYPGFHPRGDWFSGPAPSTGRGV